MTSRLLTVGTILGEQRSRHPRLTTALGGSTLTRISRLSSFEGTKQPLVPLFQRPCEWKQDNCETLWDDLYRPIRTQIRRIRPLISKISGLLKRRMGGLDESRIPAELKRMNLNAGFYA
jgi:hypothetical protein